MRPERVLILANPADRFSESVEDGVRRLGFDVQREAAHCWMSTQATTKVRAVVACGTHGLYSEIGAYYRKAGIAFAAVDRPYLNAPGQVRVAPSRTWLPEFDGPVPLDRLESLGIETSERRRVKNQCVLILGQRTGGEAHGMNRGPFEMWAQSVVERVKSLSDSRVVWRPHPADVWPVEGAPLSDPRERSLADDLAEAWLVVTYNSDAAIEALIAGLPVVAEGPAVYSEISGSLSSFGKIAAPPAGHLREVLARIAYSQWTAEEIVSGLPLRSALFGEPLPGVEEAEVEPGGEGEDDGAPPVTDLVEKLPGDTENPVILQAGEVV